MDSVLNVMPQGSANDNVPMDPVRWWPSGVPQAWSIMGTALGTFAALSRIPSVSPRMRVLASLGAMGVTSAHITYHSAIENPFGFIAPAPRLIWSWSEYQKTGEWPSLDQALNPDNTQKVTEVVNRAQQHVNQETVDKIVNEVSGQGFVPLSDFNLSDYIHRLIDFLFREVMQLLQPVYVQGFFDDLIGQRMFIEITLFISVISIIFLFVVFIVNVIFLLNKDWIINKFDNKFITFYVKYQAFLSKFTLFYIPILIFIGLFSLSHGIY